VSNPKQSWIYPKGTLNKMGEEEREREREEINAS